MFNEGQSCWSIQLGDCKVTETDETTVTVSDDFRSIRYWLDGRRDTKDKFPALFREKPTITVYHWKNRAYWCDVTAVERDRMHLWDSEETAAACGVEGAQLMKVECKFRVKEEIVS
jgi:hypothetical protein